MRRDPDIQLDVFPDVYTPAEDTFLMLSALEIVKGEKALEMGCGSGFLSLHMAKAGASVTAVDVDPRPYGTPRRTPGAMDRTCWSPRATSSGT